MARWTSRQRAGWRSHSQCGTLVLISRALNVRLDARYLGAGIEKRMVNPLFLLYNFGMKIVEELKKAYYDIRKTGLVTELHLSRSFWEQLRADPDLYRITFFLKGSPKVLGFTPIVHLESDKPYWFVLDEKKSS